MRLGRQRTFTMQACLLACSAPRGGSARDRRRPGGHLQRGGEADPRSRTDPSASAMRRRRRRSRGRYEGGTADRAAGRGRCDERRCRPRCAHRGWWLLLRLGRPRGPRSAMSSSTPGRGRARPGSRARTGSSLSTVPLRTSPAGFGTRIRISNLSLTDGTAAALNRKLGLPGVVPSRATSRLAGDRRDPRGRPDRLRDDRHRRARDGLLEAGIATGPDGDLGCLGRRWAAPGETYFLFERRTDRGDSRRFSRESSKATPTTG